jgi:hypothetical protein
MVTKSRVSKLEFKRLTHDDGMNGQLKKRRYVTPECNRRSVFYMTETSESFHENVFPTNNRLHLDSIDMDDSSEDGVDIDNDNEYDGY